MRENGMAFITSDIFTFPPGHHRTPIVDLKIHLYPSSILPSSQLTPVEQLGSEDCATSTTAIFKVAGSNQTPEFHVPVVADTSRLGYMQHG
jgi:hypothetical protein